MLAPLKTKLGERGFGYAEHGSLAGVDDEQLIIVISAPLPRPVEQVEVPTKQQRQFEKTRRVESDRT